MEAEDKSYTSRHPGGIVDPSGNIGEPTTPAVQESKGGTMGRMRFIAEAPRDATDPRGSIWDVVLISVGLSANTDPELGLPRFYSREALVKAAVDKIFEGKGAFIFEYDTPAGRRASHTPDGVPVGMFPRQKVGFYRDVRFGEFEDDDGTMKEGLLARFHLLDADLRQPLVEAWDLGEKDFLELSINGGGIVVRAEIDGVPVAKIVEITVGESVDLVSDGARGGKILRLAASKGIFKEGMMNKKLAIALIQRYCPRLLEGVDLKKISDVQIGKIALKAIDEAAHDVGAPGDAAPTNGDEPAANGDAITIQQFDDQFCLVMPDGTKGECFATEEEAKAALEQLAQAAPVGEGRRPSASMSAIDKIVKQRVQSALGEALWPAQLDGTLTAAKLPEKQVKYIRESYLSRFGDIKSLNAEIDRTKELLGAAATARAQQGGGSDDDDFGVVTLTEEKQDKIELGLRTSFREAREDFAGHPKDWKGKPFRSLYQAYSECTGDHRRGLGAAQKMLEGVAFSGYFLGNAFMSDRDRTVYQGRLKEALTTASWAQVLGNALEKERLEVADAEDLNKWRDIASVIGGTDNLFTKRRIRIGGYGTVPIVSEGEDFPAAVSPPDQEVTIDLDKRGFVEEITLEMMLRDNINQIAEIPDRMIRAGMITLQQDVFNILVNNEALSFDDDVTAIFTVAHSNLSTTALSRAEVLSAMETMMSQLQFGSSIDRLAEKNLPDLLLVDFTQWDEAETIMRAPFRFGVANEFEVPSNIQGKIRKVITISHTSDTNDWFLVNSRGKTVEIVFMNGMERPEIWVQDLPNVGATFTADKVLWKLRHWWGRKPLDFRPFFGGIVA